MNTAAPVTANNSNTYLQTPSVLPQLLSFELKYHFKQFGFWLAVLFFAWLSLIVASQRGTEQVMATSAYTVTQVLLLIAPHIIFVVCILASGVMLRDKQYQMEPLIFATPIDRFHYLASRYLALVLATCLLFVLCLVAMMFGLLLLDESKVGQFELINYLQPFFVFSLPNIILSCSLVFAVGMLTQNSIAIYVGAIVFYVFYMVGSMLGNSPLLAGSSPLQTGQSMMSLVEPYGIIAFHQQSILWTESVRGSKMPEFSGDLLLNRLLWLAVSTALFTLTYKLYAFRESLGSSGGAGGSGGLAGSSTKDKTSEDEPLASKKTSSYFAVTPNFSSSTDVLWSKIKVEYANVVKGPTFLVLLTAVVIFSLFSVATTILNGPAHGMSGYYPTTAMMLDTIAIPAERLGMLIAIFYTVELYWHERHLKMDGLVDASPCSNTTFYLAKVITLLMITLSLVTACVISAVAFQLSQGYFELQLDLYLQLYFYIGAPVVAIGLFTLFFQRLSPTKAVGLLCGFMLFISTMLIRRAGIEHPLLTPFYQPYFIYSDMADTLYHGKAVFWYNIYWLSLAMLAGVLTIKYWLRGNNRIAEKLGVGLKGLAACFIGLSILSASVIFYQNNVINDYQTRDQYYAFKANYERKYLDYQSGLYSNQPTTKQVKIEGHFEPADGRFDVTGSMMAKNLTEKPIEHIMIGFYHQPHLTESLSLTLDNDNLLTPSTIDERYHTYFFDLPKPLAPNQTITINFTMSLIYNGFAELDGEHYVSKGGSYVEFEDLMPQFGFNYNYQLSSTYHRKKQGLEAVKWPTPEQTEPVSHDNWLAFEALLSTAAPAQIVTVGQLQKRWSEGERNFALYKTDRNVAAQLAIMSAEYDLVKAHHNDVDISIYHSPKHTKDNDDMLDALAYTMDYFNSNIGAYPDKQFSIVELPYFSSAQSFGSAQPGMFVGVENRFFHLNHQHASTNQHLAGVAHEFGHQYFAYALQPNVIGGYGMLTEVLSQYMELVIINGRYGKYASNGDIRRSIDRYLQGRAFSRDIEQPLYHTGFAPHVYYEKGKQTMHALMALIGEDNINQALSIMLKEHGYPNKPTSIDLLNAFYRVAPIDTHERIDELFKTVTLHDFGLKLLARTDTEVQLQLGSSKVRIDEQGSHQQVLNETVQIGIYSSYPQIDNSNLLKLIEVKVTDSEQTVSIPLISDASYIVVDPNMHYIDAASGDNVLAL